MGLLVINQGRQSTEMPEKKLINILKVAEPNFRKNLA